MPRKHKGGGDGIDDVHPKKRSTHLRLRAREPPPSLLLLARKDMTDNRQVANYEMDFTSLRNIKCDHLFHSLSVWLADLYDPDSHEVVVSGQRTLPVNEEHLHCVMGVSRGGKDVPYNIDTEVDIELGLELFGELGYAPKMTDLVDLIKGSNNAETTFKRMWLLLARNTFISPTTSNEVSPRCYCTFMRLTFGLDIVLHARPFPINVWTKELITRVLNKDVQVDIIPFGKLPLKPEFGMNFSLFGGVEGLDKFIHVFIQYDNFVALFEGAHDVDSDDDCGDDFMDYRFARRGSKDHFVGSSSGTVGVAIGSGPAGVDTPHPENVTGEADDSKATNVEDTHVRTSDENLSESEIMLTTTSHPE
ncbi:hypothetical protein D1007_14563 [Hordeum vulgare]|nr:hypothetical protein D1007_14563 [Hordeum vulgare]